MNLTEPKKVIQIASDADAIAVDRRYYTSAENLSKQLSICSYEYELPVLKKSFRFLPSEPELGDTYIRSPFDKYIYIRLADSEDILLHRKRDCISHIAQCLGASKVKFSIQVESIMERKWDGKLKGNYIQKCAIDANIAKEQKEQLIERYDKEKVYEGKKVTLEDYNNAVKYAKEHNLEADPVVISLFEDRDPTITNTQKQSIATHSMSQELNAGLEVAFSLSAMKDVFGLGISFDNATKYEKKIKEECVIDFEK